MLIWLLLALVLFLWGSIAVAACGMAGQVSRMEEAEREIDARARELLEGIEIDLLPTYR